MTGRAIWMACAPLLLGLASAPRAAAQQGYVQAPAPAPQQGYAQAPAPAAPQQGYAQPPAEGAVQPPAPPAQTPPPPPPPPQPPPQGQWVNTAEYGWVWIPAGTVAQAVGEVPYAYLYTPAHGWTWYASPWGWGAFVIGDWVSRPSPYGYRAWAYGPRGWAWHHGPRVVVRFGGPVRVRPAPRYVAPPHWHHHHHHHGGWHAPRAYRHHHPHHAGWGRGRGYGDYGGHRGRRR